MNIKRIVISGATSMIGTALVNYAVEIGIDILCIVRKNTSRMCNIQSFERVKIVFADLCDYAQLDITGNYDGFFHIAWDKTEGAFRDDVDIQVKNVQYTLDAVRLAKKLGCSVFIGAGSQAEYGPVSVPLRSDTPINPESGYGITKYTAGKLSKMLCTQLNIRHNWIRIVSVFGPFDSPYSLIMYTINCLKSSSSPEFTKCEQLWDYLYSKDVARAFLAVGNMGINGKTYPLGSGNIRILSQYIEVLRNVLSPNVVLQFGKKEYYPHQPMYLCADISELTKDTGWNPEFTFEEGLADMITHHFI